MSFQNHAGQQRKRAGVEVPYGLPPLLFCGVLGNGAALSHYRLLSVDDVQPFLGGVEPAAAHVVVHVCPAVSVGLDTVYPCRVNALYVLESFPVFGFAVYLQSILGDIQRGILIIGAVKTAIVCCRRHRVEGINRGQAAATLKRRDFDACHVFGDVDGCQAIATGVFANRFISISCNLNGRKVVS